MAGPSLPLPVGIFLVRPLRPVRSLPAGGALAFAGGVLPDARTWYCRRVRTTSGEPPPAGSDRTGRRGLTRKIPTGNGQDGPAMRPKPPHAAESGVGKHTARESERAQACVTGKECVAGPS